MIRLVTGVELPAGWSLRPLKYLATVNDEALSEKHSPDDEILYLDIGCVGRGILAEPPSPMPFGEAPSRARRIVRNHDVLVSTVRTYLRAVLQIDQAPSNLIASTGFAVIRASEDIDSRFLYYWCLSDHFIETVVSKSVGVSYPAINARQILDIPVALPPKDVQVRVAHFLDREVARIDSIIGGVPTLGWQSDRSLVAQFVSNVQRRQRALIAAAVTGEIET